MAIDQLTASAATTDSSAASSRATLSNNFDTFLTLLTAQLQHQDPLSPMDSNQFTQQLVQFSQVEQQIRGNEQLETLNKNITAQSASTALSYLGRDAIIASDTAPLKNGQAAWSYNLGDDADQVTLEVRDQSGRTLFSADGQKVSGDHLFTWDGRMANGATAPDGAYQLVITARKGEDGKAATSTTVRDTIMGVDFTGATPQVITSSGARGLETIRAVLDKTN